MDLRFCGANNRQLVTDADGLCRTVVSHAAPAGWPNWLSTNGHTTGHLVFRWLSSDEEALPQTKLVKLAELEAALPASTARMTRAQRAEQLALRRRGVARRWPV